MNEGFSIRVKIGECEIELKGSKDDVLNVIDNLPKIVSIVSNSFDLSKTQKVMTLASKTPTKEVYPTLTVPPSASCPNAIVKILSTEWGRREPRTLRDIIEVMKINAIHYPEGTVKGRLTDLTKKGILRRIRTERGYGYILAKMPKS